MENSRLIMRTGNYAEFKMGNEESSDNKGGVLGYEISNSLCCMWLHSGIKLV